MAKKSKPIGEKLSKAQAKRVSDVRREGKAKGWSESYLKRQIAGAKAGKSRQAARGKHKGEHRERAKREREERGYSGYDERSIRNFFEHVFDPTGEKAKAGATVERMLEIVADRGFGFYQNWRDTWKAARQRYLNEIRGGTYPVNRDKNGKVTSRGRGESYLRFLADQAGFDSDDEDDFPFVYYH